MKIGYIDYLNCYPFYYHMFEKESIPGVEVLPHHPSELNRLMRDRALDLSPISAAAYADMQDSTLVLPYFCLSSIGYVRSVVLNSKVPIETLSGKTVGLTSASQTSVILLRILLEKYYALTPRYITVEPKPSYENIDAALVIGNEAMLDSNKPIQYSYDLGDLWLRKTGFPVVFAVFVVDRDCLREQRDLVKKVISSYTLSLQELRTNDEEVVRKAAERYPEIRYDIHHYYELLKFDFSANLKKALRFYFDEAMELELLTHVPEIHFAEL